VGVSHSREPDDDLARRVAEGGCILRSVVGSTVHGLSNPGTDDRDEMGVCVEPPEYVIGLRRFDHSHPGARGAHSSATWTASGARCSGSATPRAPAEVRRGGVALDEVLAELDDHTAMLERSVHDSELLEEADRAAIDDFLIGAYRRAWDPTRAELLDAPPGAAE
jgi:hypothetical protein